MNEGTAPPHRRISDIRIGQELNAWSREAIACPDVELNVLGIFDGLEAHDPGVARVALTLHALHGPVIIRAVVEGQFGLFAGGQQVQQV